MYKISNKIINFILNAMENWRVKLIGGGQTQTEVKIQRGIFQEKSILPLLFIIAIVPLSYVLRKCTWGDFPNHKKD